MLDLNANLLPDQTLRTNTGAVLPYQFNQHKPFPLPDINTRLVAISESDLAIILAMLDESQAEYTPISMTVATRGSQDYTVPNYRQRDYNIGDPVVFFGPIVARVSYIGNVDNYDINPNLPAISRSLLKERLAIIRERLMVDLTAYMTRIAEALEGIEVEVGDATSALERVATAVESQTTSEGLDDIASAVGALAPLVALI